MNSRRPSCPPEYLNIDIPNHYKLYKSAGDPKTMPFIRSRYDKATGHSPNSPRQQVSDHMHVCITPRKCLIVFFILKAKLILILVLKYSCSNKICSHVEVGSSSGGSSNEVYGDDEVFDHMIMTKSVYIITMKFEVEMSRRFASHSCINIDA